MSVHYGQTNLIIPEIDNDPAIVKVIHDGENLERETYRKEILQILKIQPKRNNDGDQMVSQALNNSSTQESNQTTPASQREYDHRPNQMRFKRSFPTTPNTKSYHYQQNRTMLPQRSLNSSGDSLHNRSFHDRNFHDRSFHDSPRIAYQNFNKPMRSDSNIHLSPASNKKTSPTQIHISPTNGTNTSGSSSNVVVTDYRQSMMMKRIVNPQWNIIPFA